MLISIRELAHASYRRRLTPPIELLIGEEPECSIVYKEKDVRRELRVPHGGFKALNSMKIALFKIFWNYQHGMTNIVCFSKKNKSRQQVTSFKFKTHLDNSDKRLQTT